jgi:hypothetical protein
LDFTNAGYASEYLMPFSLENGLNENSYLKVLFPYALHYIA